MVAVAQLVRVLDCDSSCRGFESPQPPQIKLADFIVGFFVFDLPIFPHYLFIVMPLREHHGALLITLLCLQVEGGLQLT